MARCRSCDAEVVWARMADSRKGVPLDVGDDGKPVEVPGGGLRFVAWEGRQMLVQPAHGEHGYRTHFASCPNAKAHRKPR